MTEQIRNSWDDDDFRSVVLEIEEMEDEKSQIMATARGKAMKVSERIKNRKKIAKQELRVDTDILNAVLKDRKLDRQKAKLAESIPDEKMELWIDAAGQFAFIPPNAEHPGESVAQAAARKRMAEIDEVTEREQQEGAAVLDELAGADA